MLNYDFPFFYLFRQIWAANQSLSANHTQSPALFVPISDK